MIKDELVPSENPLESSPKYRKDLAGGLLYKVLLSLYKSTSSKSRSCLVDLHRPLSSGLQTYQEKPSEFPMKKAMPKLEGPVQASGEAVFVNDLPRFQRELYAVFTLADVASATIKSIDASEALKLPGVTHFLTADDIIGENNYMFAGHMFDIPQHEVFASREVFYNGQPLGLILAETQAAALEGAKHVKVTYSEIRRPIISLEESLEKEMEFKHVRKTVVVGTPTEAWNIVDQMVEGTVRMGSQYHFYMETQVSLAVPSEDGIDLYSSTQFSDICHHAAAQVIGKPLNFINLTVPRLGGAFGGKTFDPALLSAAATLAAYVSDRPVRLNLDLASNMRIFGKRPAFIAKYKAGFNNDGHVQVVDIDYAIDAGFNEHGHIYVSDCATYLDMSYYVPNWNWVGRTMKMKTNKKTVQPTRAPGAVPAALIIETIMEHVAKTLNKHPIQVKELNLYQNGHRDIYGHVLQNCNLMEVWRRLKDVAEVDTRLNQVDVFNQDNTWRKRAITLTPCKHGILYLGPGFGATVSIFCRDGSVVITQGGVEMGQGLYTKVAQGVAHVLGVPLENIRVRPLQSISSPNSTLTAASITSESAMQAAIDAAQTLKERMRPIREKFPDLDWSELCLKCDASGVDLSVRCFNKHKLDDHPTFNYNTYCTAATETEVDVLTGQSQIRRVDIVADYGESLNPVIDIGQTEGAYIMGLGGYMLEETKFDMETGRILSDGTWNYKPPTTKDIPIDWRIHLLPDTPNPSGVRSAKACGEPGISLSTGALLANKQAVEYARHELLGVSDFIPVDAPFTPEKTQQGVGLDESVLLL
ncbi:xanthine dehydrogenase/oxidase [Elysia marginata]|uniref:Xanthine dehydrogenase/oxidase n=1 Tax=Elysia marginata TaxID=1093978 RepID=A0AAV4EP56_9GAST|nr:xanthine dehydrogenase/oxidase [Elysia marginata]